ncbi:MAG: NAD-binding protein [Burkholderiales bacterium]
MNSALFLMLRRMRMPLLVLIASYGVSILGMVLIPGVDGQGMPWRMSFFHAFYFVSYTATTIGFGEIPYAFTDAQRMWVTVSIYVTVVAWFYAIGKILQLMQDPAFQQVLATNAFRRDVHRLRDAFYIVCGYGETGRELVAAFDHRGLQTVVVDVDPARVAEVELDEYVRDMPAGVGDVRHADVLFAAGLLHPACVGIIALTDDDRANLAVAAAARLLRPSLPVVCRCESADVARNMASFGTTHILNPFALFGRHLAAAVRAPGHFLLREWLTAAPDEALRDPLFPPKGRWVLCGFGRFGQEAARGLESEGNTLAILEAVAGVAEHPELVRGRGTEPEVLRAARIEDAVGLIAGTDDDVNNLSIARMAQQINPNLFVAVRQNQRRSAVLVEALGAQLVMRPAAVVVHACIAVLMAPLLARFLVVAGERDNAWANELLARIAGVTGERVPECWVWTLDDVGAPALARRMASERVSVDVLLTDPRDRGERMALIPLAIERGGELLLLPEPGDAVATGDRILFCGRGRARRTQRMTLHDDNVLRYVLTGTDVPGGWLFERLVSGRRRASSHRAL